MKVPKQSTHASLPRTEEQRRFSRFLPECRSASCGSSIVLSSLLRCTVRTQNSDSTKEICFKTSTTNSYRSKRSRGRSQEIHSRQQQLLTDNKRKQTITAHKQQPQINNNRKQTATANKPLFSSDVNLNTSGTKSFKGFLTASAETDSLKMKSMNKDGDI